MGMTHENELDSLLNESKEMRQLFIKINIVFQGYLKGSSRV